MSKLEELEQLLAQLYDDVVWLRGVRENLDDVLFEDDLVNDLGIIRKLLREIKNESRKNKKRV